MKKGLHWMWLQGAKCSFSTIGMCNDGEHIMAINPDLRDMEIKRMGPYIGTLEDAVKELTGRTAAYIPVQKPKVKASEDVYYGA